MGVGGVPRIFQNSPRREEGAVVTGLWITSASECIPVVVFFIVSIYLYVNSPGLQKMSINKGNGAQEPTNFCTRPHLRPSSIRILPASVGYLKHEEGIVLYYSQLLSQEVQKEEASVGVVRQLNYIKSGCQRRSFG